LVKKIATTLVLLALGWTVKFGFNVLNADPVDLSDSSDTDWIMEESEWISEEIQSGVAAPARGWFDQPRHGSFEADPRQLNALIKEFHANGAENVWVVGIEEFNGAQLADSIAVELPPSGPDRDRIFAVEAALWDGEGTPDVGQSYLVVTYD